MWLLMTVLVASLGAFAVPFSDKSLQTDVNMLPPMTRVSPEDKAPEKLQTNVWLWQSANTLHVSFACEIDSSFAIGQLSTRDGVLNGDYLRLRLITLPEAYFAYVYSFAPTGNLWDGVQALGSFDINYNTGYSYTSTVKDNIWKVEATIPLGELRFKQHLPYRWKVIVSRYNKSSNESYMMPWVLTKMQNDYFAKAFDVELDMRIKRKIDVNLRPYIVKSYDLLAKTDSFDPDNLGLDIALKPDPSTRIKLSYNPDFSDVPPDDAADIYNLKTPMYYPENRFFFIEDLDVFGIPYYLLNTRKINKPSLALKATGSGSFYNWGFMGAKDTQQKLGSMVLSPDDYFQVISFMPRTKGLRLANSLISRVNNDYYNHLLATNYRLIPHQDVMISGMLMGSIKDDDRHGESDDQKGGMANLQTEYSPGDWTFSGLYTTISKDTRADMGQISEKNYQKYGGDISWDSPESKKYLSRHGGYVYYEKHDYWSKHDSEQYLGMNYYANFRPNYYFKLNFVSGEELDRTNFKHGVYSTDGSFTYDEWPWLNIYLSYSRGREMVYDLLDAYMISSYTLQLSGNVKQSFAYDLAYTLQDYGYPKGTWDVNGYYQLDDSYAIVNAKLSYTPRQQLQFSVGSGLSTYEEEPIFADVNYYGNLRYEFKPECFLYLGARSHQYQIARPDFSDPAGDYYKASATAYAKLSLSL